MAPQEAHHPRSWCEQTSRDIGAGGQRRKIHESSCINFVALLDLWPVFLKTCIGCGHGCRTSADEGSRGRFSEFSELFFFSLDCFIWKSPKLEILTGGAIAMATSWYRLQSCKRRLYHQRSRCFASFDGKGFSGQFLCERKDLLPQQ